MFVCLSLISSVNKFKAPFLLYSLSNWEFIKSIFPVAKTFFWLAALAGDLNMFPTFWLDGA